jgi:hypothetical protein
MSHVIDVESVPLIEREHVREGAFFSRRLLAGAPGTPGNFALQLVSTPQGYYAPRHRHNFDQVRYQIEGEFDFDTDGKMSPGSIAYFPEGTYYGPQSSAAKSLTLVLQFGGASRSGYLSSEEYERAMTELGTVGTFSKGVFTRIDKDGTKTNKDAYQAVWERANGRPLVYPPPRYGRPVFMSPAQFSWGPLPDQSGVCCKRLGEFSECSTRLALYRIEPGSSLALERRSIYFALEGAGTVSGERFSGFATIYVREEEQLSVAANAQTQLLQLGLPKVA